MKFFDLFELINNDDNIFDELEGYHHNNTAEEFDDDDDDDDDDEYYLSDEEVFNALVEIKQLMEYVKEEIYNAKQNNYENKMDIISFENNLQHTSKETYKNLKFDSSEKIPKMKHCLDIINKKQEIIQTINIEPYMRGGCVWFGDVLINKKNTIVMQ